MSVMVKNICKSFGGQQVLKNVNYTFEEGSITALSGFSGSGKTTLANILLGLMPPDSGEVVGMEGLRVAAVFQEDRLIEHMSAFDNIALVANGVPAEEIRAMLSSIGLDEDAKRVSKYSGGMRRRVAIARALIVRPEFLILDEPFKGLDEETRDQVIDIIRAETQNATVLLITHNPEECEKMNVEHELILSSAL